VFGSNVISTGCVILEMVVVIVGSAHTWGGMRIATNGHRQKYSKLRGTDCLQVAGRHQDTASKAAHSLNRSYGSAWTHQ
jgi:hypothetical protein